MTSETRTFDDLITDLRQRRIAGEAPPVLLLGAGASVESGLAAMSDVYKIFGCTTFDEFIRVIAGYTPDERYRNMFQFLQTRDPSRVTPGYQALAALCSEAYFDLVLTTNLDPLIDDALAAARLRRKDYLLLVNSVIRNDWLARVLPERHPRVKIIKLHGDLFHRAMAWTVKEMDEFLADVSPVLGQVVKGRDVLVVGQSLRDRRIKDLVMKHARTIWFTHPSEKPVHLKSDKRFRVVIDPRCRFESLFVEVAQQLGVVEPPRHRRARATKEIAAAVPATVLHAPESGAQTMDDLMASVVAIEGPSGEKMCTGFVLAEPRVIVTDGYAMASLLSRQLGAFATVTVVTADGKRYGDSIVHRDRTHPFGVVAIEAFDDVKKFPGLRLAKVRPASRTPIHVCVAAGERAGMSTGHVKDARERTMDIDPIGRVPHMVAVDCQVAPGSSGAPVVNADLEVLGYIVAGGAKPPSFMYPSHHWADQLAAIQAPTKPTASDRSSRHRSVRRR